MKISQIKKNSCKTKYPIVLVHGIFFRDWDFYNYWGRIPKILIRNGAEIFYGNQQSCNTIEKSGQELKNNILKIIKDRGCEKVNIIAHSKGGLDSRYAISSLGLNKYVASLTTISTPHKGCKYVDNLLRRTNKLFLKFAEKSYNRIYKKLGDANPDFLAGVKDLTYEHCMEFNKKNLDMEGILYQSIASKLKCGFTADFPFNICYIIALKFDGINDGLVGVESTKWGEFLGVLDKGRKGISHGDIVDIKRKNIDGFNICDFYVNIVRTLKEKGY